MDKLKGTGIRWLLLGILCILTAGMFPISAKAEGGGKTSSVVRSYSYEDPERQMKLLELYYPEVSGMEDGNLQDNINILMQQKTLDLMFDRFFYYLESEYTEPNELQENRQYSHSIFVKSGNKAYLYEDVLKLMEYYVDFNYGKLSAEDGVWNYWMEHDGQIVDYDVGSGQELRRYALADTEKREGDPQAEYDFSIPEKVECIPCKMGRNRINAERKRLSVRYREYQYQDRIYLKYPQISGMKDLNMQGKINDYLLQKALDPVVKNLLSICLNEPCYGQQGPERDALSVRSEVMDLYLNDILLSVTERTEVFRKACRTENGTYKESLKKGPYVQAFNYDLHQGKEVSFGEVFRTEDALWNLLSDELTSIRGELGYQYGDDSTANYRFATSKYFFTEILSDEDARQGFSEGKNEEFHWFLKKEKGETCLCLYKCDAIDSMEKCIKIPIRELDDFLRNSYARIG